MNFGRATCVVGLIGRQLDGRLLTTGSSVGGLDIVAGNPARVIRTLSEPER
jgi:acetyltransferase-like isoleucine patch superfamily enzyme